MLFHPPQPFPQRAQEAQALLSSLHIALREAHFGSCPRRCIKLLGQQIYSPSISADTALKRQGGRARKQLWKQMST